MKLIDVVMSINNELCVPEAERVRCIKYLVESLESFKKLKEVKSFVDEEYAYDAPEVPR